MRAGLAALAVGAFVAVSAAPAAAAGHDWTRFGFNAARSNSSTAVAGIGAGDLKTLKRQDVAIPGTADSSPAYLHDVQIRGIRRDVFIVTTSYGRTLALSAGKGRILWTFTPASVAQLERSKQYTTSSPVADPKRGFVYAASPDGLIHKLRIADGTEVLSGSWPTVITRDPFHEKIGTALNLSHGYVIATTGGFAGDIPPYQGHVALIDRDTGALRHVFNALCADRRELMDPSSCDWWGSAMWARSGAVVVPKSHRLLVATGNGNWNGKTNWGDSVLELSPDATKLKDSWTPTNQGALDHFDFDLGSTAPALLRSGSGWLALQSGKDGLVRLLDVGDLNGHGHACACTGGELQAFRAPGEKGVYSTPAAWRHNGKTWAFIGKNAATAAYRLEGNPPRLRLKWSHPRSGTSPVIAGDLLYVYDPSGGGVFVYQPTTGERVGVLPAASGHWSSPVVADGRVAIPVGNANLRQTTGTVTIYRKP